jgi:ribosomal protein S18 acetylase RimI-like enzyme
MRGRPWRTVLFVSLVIETTTDPELLAFVHFKTISVAYKPFFPANSSPPTALDLAKDWSERLADPSLTAFLARTTGRVNGAVAVRVDPDFDGEGQLMRLHVLPSEWRRGVGGALHDAALSHLACQGYHRAGLWVIAANTGARALYEARRWTLRPEYKLHVSGVTELRYDRSLLDCSQERPSQ